MHFEAHAKINLFLNVLGPRPDGFHEIRSVMQALALADQLTIMPEGNSLQLTCSDPALATPENLVVKAYHLFYEETGFSPMALHVHLEKNIPVAAGLGGGSSDAASMLMALKQLHGEAVSLEKMAAQLGSDVPFFLYGGTCLATGRGEKISPLPPLQPREVVLLKPKALEISAASAYQALREENRYVEKDYDDLVDLLYNDFERVLFPQYPALARAKSKLIQLGCHATLLSGSGPTLFTILDDPEIQRPKIEHAFPSNIWQVIYTNFLRMP